MAPENHGNKRIKIESNTQSLQVKCNRRLVYCNPIIEQRIKTTKTARVAMKMFRDESNDDYNASKLLLSKLLTTHRSVFFSLFPGLRCNRRIEKTSAYGIIDSIVADSTVCAQLQKVRDSVGLPDQWMLQQSNKEIFLIYMFCSLILTYQKISINTISQQTKSNTLSWFAWTHKRVKQRCLLGHFEWKRKQCRRAVSMVIPWLVPVGAPFSQSPRHYRVSITRLQCILIQADVKLRCAPF